MTQAVEGAIDVLAKRFPTLNWVYYEVPGTGGKDHGWHWLGGDDEQAMVCVYRGTDIHEQFHRQDFFFFNFAYQGSFEAVSQHRGNRILVRQNELVAGQPFTGYALDGHSDEEIINVGVLVRKELFFRRFLPLLSNSRNLMRFFLDPEGNRYSNEFIHLSARRGFPYRQLLKMMIVEYANGGPGSQDILMSMALAFTMYAARQYELENPREQHGNVVEDAIDYLATHLDTATLESTAAALGYHPNYLSGLIRKSTGKTFSQIRTEHRMRRAGLLLTSTTLPIEEVSNMLGYASTSNFYRVYRTHFGHSPREGKQAQE